MEIKRFLCVLAATFTLAACGGSQQGVAPEVTGALPTGAATGASRTAGAAGTTARHLIVMGARPDKKCPRAFSACVTISSYKSAQLYLCYSTGSYCGSPSQPQYYWDWTFTNRRGQEVYFLNASFNPNPGNPTYDTISEAYSMRSTHGKYKYVQIVCPYLGSSCAAYILIGIAIK
jgi:hypothetical protein